MRTKTKAVRFITLTAFQLDELRHKARMAEVERQMHDWGSYDFSLTNKEIKAIRKRWTVDSVLHLA